MSDSAMLPKLIAQNAELLKQSSDSRVTSVVNQNNLTMSSILREQAKKLTSLVPLTPDAFMKALMKEFGDAGGVDWAAFGAHASVYFRETPVAHGLFHMCVRRLRSAAPRPPPAGAVPRRRAAPSPPPSRPATAAAAPTPGSVPLTSGRR